MAQDDDEKRKTTERAAEETDYPEYKVTFVNDLVVVKGVPIETVSTVRGHHTFELPAGAQDVGIRVVLTPQRDHDPDVPHLKVEIRRRKANDS